MTVTLKLATSLDGRIATATGESQWITGEEARHKVHQLRSEHDAILIGVGTALADDPELTVRLPDYTGPQPARVVLDTRQRLSPECQLARSARSIPTYVVTPGPAESALSAAGVRILITPGPDRPDPRAVIAQLAGLGLDKVMIEGGGEVAASFLRAGLVDRVEWFRAPIVLGGEGRPGIGAMTLEHLASAPRFKRIEVSSVGDDLWERYDAPIMFTGIITDVGRVRAVRETERDRRFVIETGFDLSSLDIGASVAHAGCCLTVVEKGEAWFAVEVSNETLSKTTLASWGEGTRINLERAAKVGDELGGHIVSGHVDGVGEVLSVAEEGGSHRVRLRAPRPLHRYIAPKGSITVEGVSLTVNEVDDDVFGVNLIPHTWDVTTLGELAPGKKVNLEIDMLARYLARWRETA